MPAKSYFVNVDIEVMADSEQEAFHTCQAAIEDLVCGDIIDASVNDINESVPMDNKNTG